MKFQIVLMMCTVLVSGCSNQQLQTAGIGGATVNAYPQNMTNSQLCEIQIYGRPTTQTRVAVASEYTRRGLNGDYCERQYTKNTIVKWYDRWLSSQPEISNPIEATPELYK